MIATSLVSPFSRPRSSSLFVALFAAMPYVLYQAWAFVAPRLVQAREALRRAAGGVKASCCFTAGVAFAYFIVFPLMFAFFTTSTRRRACR